MTDQITFGNLVPSSIQFFEGEEVIRFKLNGELIVGEKWLNNPDEAARAVINKMIELYPLLVKQRAAEEKALIVAWLEEQIAHGDLQIERLHTPGSQKERDIAAGVVALKRAKSLIEAGEHLKGQSVTEPTDIHVVPLGDLRDHESARDCWCVPVECFDGDAVIWVHNSMDRREHTVEKGITQ